jgi:CotS family spore coat protein
VPAEDELPDVVTTTMRQPPAGASSSWRKVLRGLDIPPAVVRAYDWRVERAQSIEQVAKLVIGKRTYALKRTHISGERIRFIHELVNHVRSNGFPHIPRFALTKKQRRPYVSMGGHCYYATRWVTGTPANFASLLHVTAVAKALARFHESSRGFEPTSGLPAPMEFDLERMYKRRLDDLRVLLVEAESRRADDAFAEKLCELSLQLREDGERTLELLAEAEVQTFLYHDEENPGVCHLDVIPGNFIYDADRQVHILDLDLAAYAPRALDIAHLLRRSLQQQHWSSEVAYRCFVEYDQIRTIEKPEYTLIQALLQFPYRAWRLAHAHFRVQAQPNQVAEITDYAQQERRRQRFLTEFADQIRQVQ